MSSASKSRRSRSRKRRPEPGEEARRPQARTPVQPTATAGQRPHAPWHPLPLSEILILVGGLGTVVGLNRGGGAPLVAGLVAVGLGTFEVTLREHLGGYRSHAILLALVPALVFHTVVVLGASAVADPTQLLSILLLPFDAALFVFCFKLLRARFLEARQAQTVGRRRG